MSTRKEQLLRRAAGKKGRRVALTREEKSLRDFLEKMGGLKITDAYKLFEKKHRLDTCDDLCKIITECENFESMFAECTIELNVQNPLPTPPMFDTSSGKNFTKMFYNSTCIYRIPLFDVSNGTNFTSMFEGCKNLTEIPLLDVSSGTNFKRMFYGCNNLTEIPLLDVSNGTDFTYMFYDCSNRTEIPLLDVSNGTDFTSMFERCSNLTEIPLLDVSSGTNFHSMFYGCKNLTEIPLLDVSNGTNFRSMFYSCESLKEIPLLDVSNGTDFTVMFYGCKNLETLRLYNIRAAITIGSGTTYGHLLTVDSLVHTIQELCTVTTTRTLTMGSANLAKIAGLYCRIIDDTVEKKTMELCESTDEGAMTLEAYANLKGWKLA